jgi:hypothetical protein
VLDYIKKQLNVDDGNSVVTESAVVNDNDTNDEDVENSVLLEFAHLFQELDDLSETGSGALARNNGIDIPLEDDIEVDSVEMNLMNGNVLVPGDASVQESVEPEPEMKSYEEFYNEAYETHSRFPREDENTFLNRMKVTADKAYNAYIEQCYQEGLFDFGKIKLDDPSVAWTVTFDWGLASGTGTGMKTVELKYATQNRKITKKQRDTGVMLANSPSIVTDLMKMYVEAFKQKTATMSSAEPFLSKGLDAILKIDFIGIPEAPKGVDHYAVVICASTAIPGLPTCDLYFEFTIQKSQNLTGVPVDVPIVSNTTDQTMSARSGFLDLIQMAQESYAEGRRRIRRFDDDDDTGRFYYQEAIDFGEGGGDEDAAEVKGEEPDEGGAEVTDSGESEEREAIDTNDVSDKIVEKVKETEAEEKGAVDDVNIDDADADSVPSDDNGGEEKDAVEDTEVGDSEAPEDVSASDSEEGSSDFDTSVPTNNEDFDNMTIEDMLKLGEDKLKTMSIKQLKDFIASNGMNEEESSSEGEEPEATDAEDFESEAFFITKKNVNAALDAALRAALGILNENDISSDEIFKKFKKFAKKLNRVSAKASNMSEVYSEEERNKIGELNEKLIKLTGDMGSKSKDVATIKASLKEFLVTAQAVGKIVESKK